MAHAAIPLLSFLWHTGCMTQPETYLLSTVEQKFKNGEKQSQVRRLSSDAAEPSPGERVDQLLLPDEERGRMPFTKDQFLIRENPQLVQWERELRKFLLNLSPRHGHRVSAVMVYEWATGVRVADLVAEERALKEAGEDPRGSGKTTWRADLRKLNTLLREYFGTPYMTYIMGRKVPKAYRIPPGWYVYRHRPRTMTLYAEWADGVKL